MRELYHQKALEERASRTGRLLWSIAVPHPQEARVRDFRKDKENQGAFGCRKQLKRNGYTPLLSEAGLSSVRGPDRERAVNCCHALRTVVLHVRSCPAFRRSAPCRTRRMDFALQQGDLRRAMEWSGP